MKKDIPCLLLLCYGNKIGQFMSILFLLPAGRFKSMQYKIKFIAIFNNSPPAS